MMYLLYALVVVVFIIVIGICIRIFENKRTAGRKYVTRASEKLVNSRVQSLRTGSYKQLMLRNDVSDNEKEKMHPYEKFLGDESFVTLVGSIRGTEQSIKFVVRDEGSVAL